MTVLLSCLNSNLLRFFNETKLICSKSCLFIVSISHNRRMFSLINSILLFLYSVRMLVIVSHSLYLHIKIACSVFNGILEGGRRYHVLSLLSLLHGTIVPCCNALTNSRTCSLVSIYIGIFI
jgi:hypothetical protein